MTVYLPDMLLDVDTAPNCPTKLLTDSIAADAFSTKASNSDTVEFLASKDNGLSIVDIIIISIKGYSN